MQKIDLFHPRVFEDQKWAEGYYKRNSKNIKRVANRFVKVLKDSGFEQGRILDAGCGFGTVAVELSKAFPGSEIVGIDLAEPLLEMADRFAKDSTAVNSIAFEKGDVQQIKFKDNSFDVVINSFMLHIVEDPITMLNEIERVAKSDSRILITDLRRIWLGRIIWKLRTSYKLEEALELIENSTLRKGIPTKGPFWWDYFVV